VEVVGWEKLVAFGVEPLLDLDEGALRARAVPAGNGELPITRVMGSEW